ncbi:sedoheptulose 7-phosphate cyclase [Antribacter sp. KLBMP9083]|uniref:2-epi-5-epi-valiolone synthase n=1 Tax=Antribacter soli TaxID=2910976 RepID=A0AA41QH32_9MICO|nr:sedoheptulose 7-phosphate cyclase [Antribacter soli]MCF4123363.1 sedoheptulose 7-phosphate cyclase [Antribacter soli]
MPGNLTLARADDDLRRPPTTSWLVEATRTVSYTISVSRDVFSPDNPSLADAGTAGADNTRRRFVVIDKTVHEIYGGLLDSYLRHHDMTAQLCVLDADEQQKSMESVMEVVRGLDEFGVDRRREPIIAIGGGVVLDIVGLASSLYRRHTPYVRVPTTLIGLVDAGVGVKTGVNFNGHKNRLGTYEAPATALLDRNFLRSLDRRNMSNGLAEILKIALIKDRELFERLEGFGGPLLDERMQGATPETEAAARDVLRRAVHGMLEELQPNLWEGRLERLVDYGHSFSPSIEMAGLPELLHGEAVCIDMAMTTHIAHRRGMVTDAELSRVIDVMHVLGLPVHHAGCTPELLVKALVDTTRHRDGLQRLPLPVGIGDAAFVNDVSAEELRLAAEAVAEVARAVPSGAE